MVAVMVTLPPATAVSKPLLSMVTTLPPTGLTVVPCVMDELQVTCELISCSVPSEYTPEAVNCWVNPACIAELAGVTNMERKVAEVTVRVAFPDLPPKVAVMVGVPAARAVAKPLLLTVAIDVSEEVQATFAVMSKLVASEYIPRAVNCWVTPEGRLGLAGVTNMEDSDAEVTVRVVFRDLPPKVAVMVGVPVVTAVARPVLSTVADVSEEVQVTLAVMS
jgi:hypothetical protein